ncbi:MAG: lytic murein transglycosylase, partial [Caulobacteraceae bacterium]|nr:lytic murein transglycosylase [Caulobacteraceae bacterium]
MLVAPALPRAQTASTPATPLAAQAADYFTDWLKDFRVRAVASGIPAPVVERELAGLAPDPRVAALDARQPEFARPVSDYIHGALSDARIAQGRAKRLAIVQLGAIEATYGVPRDILVAIWAMESGFGAVQGEMDVIRSLASLAALGRRRPFAEREILAALTIIASGDQPRARLRGSWAGAMGQVQMLPSTYLADAVDGDGDGKRDIWGSPPDALASAANLLAKSGWRRGEDWAREAILPAGFDYGLTEGPKETPAWWRAKGVRRADGLAWKAADEAATCTL